MVGLLENKLVWMSLHPICDDVMPSTRMWVTLMLNAEDQVGCILGISFLLLSFLRGERYARHLSGGPYKLERNREKGFGILRFTRDKNLH